MFEALTDKLKKIISGFSKEKVLTEKSLVEATRKVRLALLDADVNYAVASKLVHQVKEKALGQKWMQSVRPTEQFVKIVYDELIELMGKEEAHLSFRGNPATFLLVGLQGSGKTTTCVKLANYLKGSTYRKKVLLAACDLQRPAAVQQLKIFAGQAGVDVFFLEGESDPLQVAKQAHTKARVEGYEVLIVDTAGRLHIDEPLMKELQQMKQALDPSEILFVANATHGQDIVRTIQEFDQRVSITGSILTMLDGNARAGAAISIYEITKKPLKFEGVGEKVEEFQRFHPRSMADRILGMGDIINLVRKAQSTVDEKEKEQLERKIRKAEFTFEDYLQQMAKIRKMGSFQSLLKMIPGASSLLQNFSLPEEEFKRSEAIILSMRPEERKEKVKLDISRRMRISRGAGVPKEKVDQFIKSFQNTKKMMKKLPNMGKMPDLQSINLMGKMKWR